MKQQIIVDTLVILTKFKKIFVLNFSIFYAYIDIENLIGSNKKD
jgi:hypothetical protein